MIFEERANQPYQRRVFPLKNDSRFSFADLVNPRSSVVFSIEPSEEVPKRKLREFFSNQPSRKNWRGELGIDLRAHARPLIDVPKIVAEVTTFCLGQFKHPNELEYISVTVAQGQKRNPRPTANRILKGVIYERHIRHFCQAVNADPEYQLDRCKDGFSFGWTSDDWDRLPLDENKIDWWGQRYSTNMKFAETIFKFQQEFWPRQASSWLVRRYLHAAFDLDFDDTEFLINWDAYWHGEYTDCEINARFLDCLNSQKR